MNWDEAIRRNYGGPGGTKLDADPICCELAEDDPDHDVEQCLADGAEAAAEAKAERMREEAMDEEYGRWEPWA